MVYVFWLTLLLILLAILIVKFVDCISPVISDAITNTIKRTVQKYAPQPQQPKVFYNVIEKKEQPVIQVISVEDKPVPKKEDNNTTPKSIPCPTQHKKMIELPAEECEESEEEEYEETSETSETETQSLTSIVHECEDVAVDVIKQLIKGQQKDIDEHINKLIEDAINKYKEEQKPKDTEQANIQKSAEAPAEDKPADK